MKHIFTIKIGSFQFSSTILILVSAVFLVAVFAGLGRWQLDRMYEKLIIEDQYQERSNQEYQALETTITNPEEWRYRKVYITGKWLVEKQLLLDNQVRNKQAGYNVITLFKTDDGQHILIDRGWLPLVNSAREILPDVSFSSSNESEKIKGQFYVPFKSNLKVDKKWFQAKTWPTVIPELDFPVIQSLLGVPLEKYVIRMSSDDRPGYLRTWKTMPFSSDKHLGYVIQWFALALTVFIVLVVVNTKRIKK